jgi:hypothetical protein
MLVVVHVVLPPPSAEGMPSAPDASDASMPLQAPARLATASRPAAHAPIVAHVRIGRFSSRMSLAMLVPPNYSRGVTRERAEIVLARGESALARTK